MKKFLSLCFFLILILLSVVNVYANPQENIENSKRAILPINEKEPVYLKYNKKIQKYIAKKTKVSQYYYCSDNMFCAYIADNAGRNKKYYKAAYDLHAKFILTNGDYAKLYADEKTIGIVDYMIVEYHSDNTVMGYVVVDVIKNSDSIFKAMLYEYRINNATKILIDDKHSGYLNNIIYMEFNKKNRDKRNVQFIYTPDGSIKIYRVGNRLYSNSPKNELLVNTDRLKIISNTPLYKRVWGNIQETSILLFLLFLI